MKSVAEQMTFYDAYHKNAMNKMTHFVGIPLIMFAILMALSWIQIPIGAYTLTGGVVLAAFIMAYYVALDPGLAGGMLVVLVPMLYLAYLGAEIAWVAGIGLFLGTFVFGWIMQLVGHSVFEKRRPAFTDNLIQLLIGPLFFVAEVYFALGLKRDLRARMRELEASLTISEQAAG